MAPQSIFKQLELSQLRANKSNIREELTDIPDAADDVSPAPAPVEDEVNF